MTENEPLAEDGDRQPESTATQDDRGSGPTTDPAGVLSADLAKPMAIRVAATLRLADLMANGPVGADTLAAESGSDPDALTRMLRFLVSRGVFTEPQPGAFALNDAASMLRSDHPSGMVGRLDLDGLAVDMAFTELLHTVRTGEPAFERVFGAPFWSYMSANPALGASFDQAMAEDTEFKADAATAYDWTGVRTVVDVGGGTGAFLAEVLQPNLHLRGTLVERADTLTRARTYLTSLGLDGRCSLVEQSFFDPLPSGADVYVLSGVLADWPDKLAVLILRRCAEAMGDSGRLLVIEHPSTDPQQFARMDMLMLILFAGKGRTPDDNIALAADAGLHATMTTATPRGHVIIEFTNA